MPQSMTLSSIKFIHITVSEIQPEQDFKLQQSQRSNQGHTMMLQPAPTTNVSTKYQLSTPYTLRENAWTRF